jgi:hypothetical protein
MAEPSLNDKVQQRAYDAIDAINQLIMQNNDAEARRLLLDVRDFCDVRIKQCVPLLGQWAAGEPQAGHDPDGDLL